MQIYFFELLAVNACYIAVLLLFLVVCLIYGNATSLSDAEMFEDVLEDGIGGDFAYDIGEVVDSFAEVLGDELVG